MERKTMIEPKLNGGRGEWNRGEGDYKILKFSSL